MPWFLVDDGFHSHPWALATSPAALGLWAVAGSWSSSSSNLTDGFVPDHVLPRLSPDSATLAAELAAAGLWRRVKGGYRFVQGDGLCKIPGRAAVLEGRASGKRRQALFRDPELKRAVRDRDRDGCRYCGRPVRWGKGQAPDSATYSHVDPGKENTLDNIVTACLTCSTAKGTRSLSESGLRLVSPGQNLSRNASRNATAKGSQEGAHTDTYKPPYPPHVRPGPAPSEDPHPRTVDPERVAGILADLHADLASKAAR